MIGAACIVVGGIGASERIAQSVGGSYFGLIHKNIGFLHPPPQVFSAGAHPLPWYMRPGIGLGTLHISLQMLAI